LNLRTFIWLSLFLGIFSFSFAHSPDSLWHLTIHEITIEHSREQFFREDKKILRPDSLQMQLYRNSTIGELLKNISPVYVNSYGSAGSLSGLILRGTGSSQSLVLWNGFPLNSLSLGSADLSLLPVSGFNDISLTYSAAGSIYSSGAFGGSLDLHNSPVWEKGLRLIISPEAGSYGDKRISFSASGGTNNFQFHTTLMRQQGDYNFIFTDTYKDGRPIETIQNNSLSNTLFLQNVFIKLPQNNQLEAGFWYQDKVKEIPAIMGSYSSGTAHQRDSVFRVYARWKKLFKSSSLQVRTAWFTDQIHYKDSYSEIEDQYLVDSRIRNGRTMADGFYRMYLGNHLSFDGGAGLSVFSAHVSSYGGKMSELVPAFFSGIKFRNDQFVANLSIRKEFYQEHDVKPLISAGFRSEIIRDKFVVRGNISDQFRVPTFNDKYWKPGGNPELLPERGWTSDAGFEFTQRINATSLIHWELTGFYGNIRNLIQWLPSETFTFWSPVNTRHVISRGMEAGARYAYVSGGVKLRLHASYTLSKSQIKATPESEFHLIGKELIYRPNHIMNLYSNAETGNFSFAINFGLTGKRHTTEDNNPAFSMPMHMLFNIYAGYSFSVRDLSGTLQLKVNNLFDQQYQVVRSYAMPGRTYQIGITFHFLTLKN
jgi:vitamin B12 transporter